MKKHIDRARIRLTFDRSMIGKSEPLDIITRDRLAQSVQGRGNEDAPETAWFALLGKNFGFHNVAALAVASRSNKVFHVKMGNQHDGALGHDDCVPGLLRQGGPRWIIELFIPRRSYLHSNRI